MSDTKTKPKEEAKVEEEKREARRLPWSRNIFRPLESIGPMYAMQVPPDTTKEEILDPRMYAAIAPHIPPWSIIVVLWTGYFRPEVWLRVLRQDPKSLYVTEIFEGKPAEYVRPSEEEKALNHRVIYDALGGWQILRISDGVVVANNLPSRQEAMRRMNDFIWKAA